jgi:hypothetical protein
LRTTATEAAGAPLAASARAAIASTAAASALLNGSARAAHVAAQHASATKSSRARIPPPTFLRCGQLSKLNVAAQPKSVRA